MIEIYYRQPFLRSWLKEGAPETIKTVIKYELERMARETNSELLGHIRYHLWEEFPGTDFIWLVGYSFCTATKEDIERVTTGLTGAPS